MFVNGLEARSRQFEKEQSINRRMRFRLRFGKTGRGETKWLLGGKDIHETDQNKNLGEEINEQFKKTPENRETRMMRGEWMRRGEMSVSDRVGVWQTLVRPAVVQRCSSVGRVFVGKRREFKERETARIILESAARR